jgi:hypothetical protein
MSYEVVPSLHGLGLRFASAWNCDGTLMDVFATGTCGKRRTAQVDCRT